MVSKPVGETVELCTVVEYRSRFDGARNERPQDARSVVVRLGRSTADSFGLNEVSARSA